MLASSYGLLKIGPLIVHQCIYLVFLFLYFDIITLLITKNDWMKVVWFTVIAGAVLIGQVVHQISLRPKFLLEITVMTLLMMLRQRQSLGICHILYCWVCLHSYMIFRFHSDEQLSICSNAGSLMNVDSWCAHVLSQPCSSSSILVLCAFSCN